MDEQGKTITSKWIDNYSDGMYNYAFVRVNNRETAKDLVQDTFLSALQNIDSFRGDSSEKTWLYSILKNKIIDHYRKKAADKSVSYSGVNGTPEPDFYFDEEGEWKVPVRPLDWGKTGYDKLYSKEFIDILHKCLSMLTEQGRTIFIFKYIEEMEFEEICKELNISSSNYWVVMHRSKLQLRQCIDKNWINA
jgi:RNA polymerase sigma-70 factor (TIGR02943 family)